MIGAVEIKYWGHGMMCLYQRNQLTPNTAALGTGEKLFVTKKNIFRT